MVSSKFRYPKTFSSPTGASSLNSSIPLICSSLRNILLTPNSTKEQHIPSDSTPLITEGLIVTPKASNLAPLRATMTLSPTRTFGAPQTIWRTPNFSPSSTFKTCK